MTMTRRAREARAEREAHEENAAGLSRGEKRLRIEGEILALLAYGPKTHAEVSRRVVAPRAAVAARVKALLRRREIAWVHGGKRLALYRMKDVV